MRILSMLLATLSGLTPFSHAVPAAPKKLKVFVLAGQSNMDGRADFDKISDEDKDRLKQVQPRVRLAYNMRPVVPLTGTQGSEGLKKKYGADLSFGPEIFFGIRLAEAYPADEFLLIKRSLGNLFADAYLKNYSRPSPRRRSSRRSVRRTTRSSSRSSARATCRQALRRALDTTTGVNMEPPRVGRRILTRAIARFHQAAFLALVVATGFAQSTPQYQTVDELWAGFDPRALPVETEVFKETVRDGLVLRTVYYTSEIKDGFKVRIVAYYGFPVGGKNLPAIMHLHGGGQNATLGYVKYWAERGYATLSINWGGRPLEGNEANGRTNWGPLPYNQNSDDTGSVYNLKPNGRANSWYHWAIAGRRGLTFLEQQPEVDPARIGMFGVSMGGRLTWLVAGTDHRLRCAASVYGATLMDEPVPGVAGSEFVPALARQKLWRPTLDAFAYASRIKCAFFFLSAANDFFGRLDHADRALREIPGNQHWWTLTPHFSHHIRREESVALVMWMDRWLKGGKAWPAPPVLALDLQDADRVPTASVSPQDPADVAQVSIQYSTGRFPQARFWRTVDISLTREKWQAKLPLTVTDDGVVVMAKVVYQSGLVLNSRLEKATGADLRVAGIAATDPATRVIDDFSRGAVDWFVTEVGPNPLLVDKNFFRAATMPDGAPAIACDPASAGDWRMFTRKVGDRKWQGPAGAGVQFEVRAEAPNEITVVAIQNFESQPWPARVFVATARLAGGNWEQVALKMADFREVTRNTGLPLASWEGINLLGIVGRYTFVGNHMHLPDYAIGTKWTGPAPAIAKLRWQ